MNKRITYNVCARLRRVKKGGKHRYIPRGRKISCVQRVEKSATGKSPMKEIIAANLLDDEDDSDVLAHTKIKYSKENNNFSKPKFTFLRVYTLFGCADLHFPPDSYL